MTGERRRQPVPARCRRRRDALEARRPGDVSQQAHGPRRHAVLHRGLRRRDGPAGADDPAAQSGRAAGLELHYQPIVDLDKAEMVGVEALIRWPDPNGGLVPPGDFIPLAEEMGLIEAIGDWVVEEVARQDVVWRERRPATRARLQPFPASDVAAGLAQKIMERLVACDVEPQNVVVEITESTAMIDPGSHAGDPPRPARSGPPPRDRRLRHRILVAVAAQAPARRHPQDRPGVRARRRQRSQRRKHGLRDDRAGRLARHDPARRRHRDRGGMEVPRRPRMPARPGVLLLATVPAAWTSPRCTGAPRSTSWRAAPDDAPCGAGAQRRRRGRSPVRLPFAPPLNTTRGGATFIPSSSNSSWRSSRAAIRLTSPCCSGVTSVMPVPERPARAVRPTRWTYPLSSSGGRS